MYRDCKDCGKKTTRAYVCDDCYVKKMAKVTQPQKMSANEIKKRDSKGSALRRLFEENGAK